MMGGEDGLYNAGDGTPGPDDLGLAWDAAERYAITLLREALPEAQAVPVPAGELAAEAARFRSAARKWAVPATGPRGMGPAAAQAVTG